MLVRRDPESVRLAEDARRERNWKRWGPYLAERQWGTVREDYSANGECWTYLPHDHARSRAYRWGEDGLMGFCDRQGRLCFALALWNGHDPILKERLFGLTGPEGNHGEDLKESYFYLDSTPTHSYFKSLYKYPQAAFPYERLVRENRQRTRSDPELELLDTGAFAEGRYFDLVTEYAKASPDDILIRLTVTNRGPEAAQIHVLPTLWFRNTWAWGREGEDYGPKPQLGKAQAGCIHAEHSSLLPMALWLDPSAGEAPLLFTENETNMERLFGTASASPYRKDAFHERVVSGKTEAINPAETGTKAAAWFQFRLAPDESKEIRLRLCPSSAGSKGSDQPDQLDRSDRFGPAFVSLFDQRIQEANGFYTLLLPNTLEDDERAVARQAYAGLLGSKQFYFYVLEHWLQGDPSQPRPPAGRDRGRNSDWPHLYNRDVISMPDKWEYPWYAAWDLAFHMIPFARIDPDFAKHQLTLLLREWYMHPNGQIPAYEFAFGDVNPPVHAWAAWRVYKMSGRRGERDRDFLASTFQKLLLNFTWWVNRKDEHGKHIFAGGFLGLDNIGIFDRSQPLPTGGSLEQADGTAWMAFFAVTLLAMALELAQEDPAYEDLASKFFEHFIHIVDAMNHLGGSGLWDEADGFYYDRLHIDGQNLPLRVRSMVGVVPLFAVEVLEDRLISRLPGFSSRLNWFLKNRKDLARHISYLERDEGHGHRLLALPSKARLERALRYILDEREFLSPYGVRSLSRFHAEQPYVFSSSGREYRVEYVPGESNTWLFGGNSNWRGPVWFPLNYLLIESLQRYHHFYGDAFRVECPTGSGNYLCLDEVAAELEERLCRLFLADRLGHRPCHGGAAVFASDPHWKHLLQFHEYFHGENGKGLGASHQTGWTALVANCLEDIARRRG